MTHDDIDPILGHPRERRQLQELRAFMATCGLKLEWPENPPTAYNIWAHELLAGFVTFEVIS